MRLSAHLPGSYSEADLGRITAISPKLTSRFQSQSAFIALYRAVWIGARSVAYILPVEQTVCVPQFVFFTNPINRFLLIFNTTPEFRSATSLTLYSAAVPRTCAVSEGVSL